MKAKLLRRLRCKYAKKYCITKAGNGDWKVWFGNTSHSYWMVSSIEEAQEKIKAAICVDISDKLIEIRKKQGRKHGIKYYPWVILLALLPIFAFAQTRQDVLRELHRQQVPHPTIVLAQARLESGNFKSDFYRKTNNLFGLKKGGRYAIYKHWRNSIKDYKLRISSRYQGGCYYKFLTRIGYAKDEKYNKKLQEITNGKNRH